MGEENDQTNPRNVPKNDATNPKKIDDFYFILSMDYSAESINHMSDCPVKCSSTVSVIAAFQQNTMDTLNMPQLFQEYLEMAGFRGNTDVNPTPTPTPTMFLKLN